MKWKSVSTSAIRTLQLINGKDMDNINRSLYQESLQQTVRNCQEPFVVRKLVLQWLVRLIFSKNQYVLHQPIMV